MKCKKKRRVNEDLESFGLTTSMMGEPPSDRGRLHGKYLLTLIWDI